MVARESHKLTDGRFDSSSRNQTRIGTRAANGSDCKSVDSWVRVPPDAPLISITMKPHSLDYCEFYITNVCNLNCDNCNRFNNYAFSGHQDWAEYQSLYQEWSKILDVKKMSILGGEPMLHPDFMTWLTGIADLWPGVELRIITNGTQIHRWPELYNILTKYQGQIWLEINVHSPDQYANMVAWADGFLQGGRRSWHNHIWQQSYNHIKDSSWPHCDGPESFDLLPELIRTECQHRGLDKKLANSEFYDVIDDNLVRVAVCRAWKFYPSAVKFDGERLTLHSSDPEKAMAACLFKPCHHFIQGALYKCGPVGLFPNFIKQFPVHISRQEQELIHSYVPATPDWDGNKLDQFIQNLRDAVPIDQCRFCPENTHECGEIASSTKKIRIQKLSG